MTRRALKPPMGPAPRPRSADPRLSAEDRAARGTPVSGLPHTISGFGGSGLRSAGLGSNGAGRRQGGAWSAPPLVWNSPLRFLGLFVALSLDHAS